MSPSVTFGFRPAELQESCQHCTAGQEGSSSSRLDRGAETRNQVTRMLVTAVDLTYQLPSQEIGCKCREAFDLFDTDGSGTIDAKELKVAMRY